MSLTITDLECNDPEQFVRQCRDELKRYPRSPVVVTPETAKAIDISGIFHLGEDETRRELLAMGLS